MIAAEVLTGGFTDPVFQSQAVFRTVLDAFARPGTIVTLPDAVSAPAPLYASTAAFLCTFADEGTPIHFDDEAAAGAAAAWVTFHTGAPAADRPGAAQFAVVTSPGRLPPLESFAQGSQEYPDRSTTVLLQIEDFAGRAGLRLSGPGVDGIAEAGPRPLPPDFPARLQRNRSLFPRGVDLVLASPAAILALPRSVRVSALRGG
jgi:alpha-D-ribose 1-methylphosphonate 5-triphosphate synthase subunit PhnH